MGQAWASVQPSQKTWMQLLCHNSDAVLSDEKQSMGLHETDRQSFIFNHIRDVTKVVA